MHVAMHVILRRFMNAQVFISYELEVVLNNPCILNEDEFICMFNERDDAIVNNFMEVVENVQIGDVVDRVWFKDAKCAFGDLETIFRTKPIDVTPLIQYIWTLQKETLGSWRAQGSHQTTLKSLFYHYTTMCDDIHILCNFILYLYRCYYFYFQSHTSVIHVGITYCLVFP